MPDSATFWNKIAEKYAAKPLPDQDSTDRKIEVTRSLMRPDHVVLDIGCGTGTIALRLADTGAEVHGADISAAMIRIAEDKASKQGIDNVHFHALPFDDSMSLFEDDSLDGICAYNILHLVEDRQERLAQIYRMLKPGGFFVASTPCLRESWIPLGPVIKVTQWIGKAPSPVASIRKRELIDEMRAVGFVDIEQPDVGAKAMVGFTVARKPVQDSPAQTSTP